MNMILMIDNQDSFTYNLIDYIKVQTTEEVKIISVNDLMTQHLDAIQKRLSFHLDLGNLVIIQYYHPY